MAQPNPIYVSPSTTFVQVNPLQSPYNPVLLNAVVYPGQVVSVLDATSSFGVLTNPIVVSTVSDSFQDGSISTVINQPQGFLTAQTLPTNKWAFLNSFPFRNQYVSAGVQTLTTSTLFTALASTVQEYVSSLTVESLTVSGNFLQTQGITLNTNISSLGTVEFVSSLSVWDTVYLSSALSTVGPVELYSSLTVLKDFFTKSSITTVSSFFISGSLLSMGSLSTPSLVLQDGLVGTTLEVQNSTPTDSIAPFSTVGNVQILGSLSSFSSLYLGGYLVAASMMIESNVSFLSSAAVYGVVSVSSLTSTTKDVSTFGSMGVGGQLFVGYDLTTHDSIRVSQSGYIRDLLTIGSTLITSSLITSTLETFGDYANNSTIAQISSISVENGLGVGFLYAPSSILQNVETYSNLVIGENLYTQSYLDVAKYISVLRGAFVGQSIFLEGSLSTNTLIVSNSLSTAGSVVVSESTITNSNIASALNNTSVIGSVLGLGDLTCDGVFTISSINLPSSLLGNSFTTGAMNVGTFGIAKDTLLQKILTSSITLGYIPNTQYAFDLSGSLTLSSVKLSSLLVSTQILSLQLTSNSQIQVSGGMGVGVEPPRSSFVCHPTAYFLSSPIYVFSTLSTAVLTIPGSVTGTFSGDGSQLSNIPYPTNISCFDLTVSKSISMNSNGFLETSSLKANSLFVSNSNRPLAVPVLQANSTLQVGSFSIQGNANTIELNQQKNILQTNVASNLLVLNDMKFYAPSFGGRVLINTDLSGGESATLVVSTTLGVEIINTDFSLPVDIFKGKKVIAEQAYGTGGYSPIINFINYGDLYIFTNYGDLYISTGVISTATELFFIGEKDAYNTRFNTVQPFQSTLQFNSTLFVNRYTSSVGINTKPNFNLDAQIVANEIYNTYAGASSITNQVQLFASPSSFTYYAFVQPTETLSNVQTSTDGRFFRNVDLNLPISYGTTNINSFFGSYFASGLLKEFGNLLFPQALQTQYLLGSITTNNFQQSGVLAVSKPPNEEQVYYSIVFESQFGFGTFPSLMRAMATDGVYYLAAGTFNIGVKGVSVYYGKAGQQLFGDFPPADIAQFFIDLPKGELMFLANGTTICGAYDIVYGGTASPYFIVVGTGRRYESNETGSAYRIEIIPEEGGPEIDVDIQELYTGVDELRAITVYTAPFSNPPFQGGETVYVATGRMFEGEELKGRIAFSRNNGGSWDSQPLFTNTGLCVATDGNIIVYGGEDIFGRTLYWQYLSGNPLNVGECTGTLFSLRTNSVIFTGSKWIAAGNSGILESMDGIDWYDPGANLPTEVLGLGFTSNVIPSMNIGVSTPLYIQESPYVPMQRLLDVPTIASFSTGLVLNNACALGRDSMFLVGFDNYIRGTLETFPSTLVALNTYVSSFVCTNQFSYGTGYNLSLQTV